jgi:hypothetical protein
MFGNQHEAFAIITKDVRDAIARRNKPNAKTQVASAFMAQTDSFPRVEQSGPRSSNLRLKKKFDDHERDQFLEDSYEYIARYFEGSLNELETRNSRIKTRFKRIDATSFSASVYENGTMKATCSIWYGGNHVFGKNSICYSNSQNFSRNSMNGSLQIEDDGYTLHLKPTGMFHSFDRNAEGQLSQQGAAECYWSMLIHPLQ